MKALGFTAKEEAKLTTLRDIKDLIVKGILQQTDEKGRSANYELVEF